MLARRKDRPLMGAFVAIATVLPQPARAAEIKLSLTELASILTAATSEAKVRLHNVPGTGKTTDQPASFLKLGTATVPLPIPAKTFEAEGATYGYYVSSLDSGPITVTVVPSALRLTVPFVTHGAAVVGRCLDGLCVPSDSLPEVQWTNSAVTFDLTPVALNGSLSLVLKSVDIGGTFTPDCKAAGDFVSGGICGLVLSKAKETVATLKSGLDETLKDEVNDATTQEKLSAAVGSYLMFGPAGHVQISNVVLDETTITITICVGCAGK